MKAFALGFVLCLAGAVSEAQTVHPDQWPSLSKAVPHDARIEKAVNDLMTKMTLEEKVAQTIQPSVTSVTPADVKQYHFGSVLNGGGFIGDPRKATPKDWLAKSDEFYDASMDTSGGKNAIPIIWGSDGVHGHNNVVGATLFPHNIGMGATRDYDLIRKAGEITAIEMAVTGIDWCFSPVVAVARDDRWGRTYESYSEDPAIVRKAAEKMIEGLQGVPTSGGFLQRGKVIATAKHFIGDGGTVSGKDQGDNVATEQQLRNIHAAGYLGAMKSGAQTVMLSQSAWHGREMHGNRALITDILKGRLGFDGFVIGDWNGHGQVPGCSNRSCPDAINAGLDMFMVPDDWKALYENTLAQVRGGQIPMQRLDDAVRRILRVKMRAGLFAAGKPSQRPLGGKFESIGSVEHREIARQAVRESIVLLKNNGGVLPIRATRNVLVTGDGADNIGKQAGGWTLSWQGDGNTNENFPGGNSIWAGIRNAVEAAGGHATLSADGSFAEKPDVAVVVFGENPYAEWEGDRQNIVFQDEKSLAILQRLKDSGIPVVSIFLSGRPLWINPYLNVSDAFVAAFLPGTEGEGIADVLITAPDGMVRNDFHGKLSFSWPQLPVQVVLNRGAANYDPLFPLGFGLTYNDRKDLAALPVDTSGVQVSRSDVFFVAGHTDPWKLTVDERIVSETEAGGRKVFSWPGGERRDVALTGTQPVDLSKKAGWTLAVDVLVEKRPTQPVTLSLGGGAVDITPRLRAIPSGEWKTMRIPLRCFARAGADLSRVDTPFRVSTEGELGIRFADIEMVPLKTQMTCPAAVNRQQDGR
jgi:beta-glucosidase